MTPLESKLMAPPSARRHVFGWSGLIVGLFALALGLLPGWIAPLYDPPGKPVQQRAADWLGELKDKAVATLRMEPPPPPPPEHRNVWRDPRIAVWSLLLGFAALLLGIVSFVRHEDQRLVACTIALGAGTICSQYFLTAVVTEVTAAGEERCEPRRLRWLAVRGHGHGAVEVEGDGPVTLEVDQTVGAQEVEQFAA